MRKTTVFLAQAKGTSACASVAMAHEKMARARLAETKTQHKHGSLEYGMYVTLDDDDDEGKQTV